MMKQFAILLQLMSKFGQSGLDSSNKVKAKLESCFLSRRILLCDLNLATVSLLCLAIRSNLFFDFALDRSK